MSDHFAQVAEAFSRKALLYDKFGQGHENLARMRSIVRAHVMSFLKDGDCILELNAGTGSDAVFFAGLGYRVHATDLSAGMVAQIEDKIARNHLEGRLSVQQCSFTRLEDASGGPYDYILSNMGGVNCIEDLSRITRGLPCVLAPGGVVTWVVMPPFCPWELAGLLRGDLRTALRRFSPDGTLANVEGVRFMTYYYTPGQVQRAFGRDYSLLKLQGLSVFAPPADKKYFSSRHHRLYLWLSSLDERLSLLPPFNRWGDFFIISMRYLPESKLG